MANLQSFERTDYQQVKADLHRKILDRLDLEKLGKTSGDSARDEVLVVIRNTVNSEVVPLSFAERESLSREILDEIFGLGPLEPLLKDHTVSDILVNRFDRVYVSVPENSNSRCCRSKTIRTSCRSSSGLSPAWGAAWMNLLPWSTPALPTDRASMPSFLH